MVRKIELATRHEEPFGNPAPLGLLGLAVGCAALTPIAFGHCLDAAGLTTAAVLVILFGGGCQLLAGFMEMRNRNGFGGVIFTTFAFLWFMNGWELLAYAAGTPPSHGIKLALDVLMLLILVPLTFGFGYFSSLLFAFLVDIDLLFLCKVIRGATGTAALNTPIAILTVILGLLAVWIALATLVNPVAGRQVFRVTGPLFFSPKRPRFDFTLRARIFDVLYGHWRDHAFAEMPVADLQTSLADALGDRPLRPDLEYLAEFGYLALSHAGNGTPTAVRLTASGIDLHEQLALHKYEI